MSYKVSFFLLIFLYFSCSEGYDNSSLTIFKYNESAGINTLDPIFAKDQATIWATSQIFNGLVQLDSNLNVQPCIAQDWSISNSGLSYTFNLRNDVFFHSDNVFENKTRKVIASDFTYSFDRLLNPAEAAPGAWVLSNVKEYYAINDSLFIIELRNPFPAFLALLSMQYCSVVPKEVVESKNFHINPIGTGPFCFQYWEDGIKLVFRKNTNYFERKDSFLLPYLDAISITFIKDKQSAFLQFIQGNLDFLSGIDGSYKDEVLTKEGLLRNKYKNKLKLYSQPYLNTEYFGFLMDDSTSILEEKRIRQAINYGFDRNKMIKYLRNGIGEAASFGFIPDGMPGFSKAVKGYVYDTIKAKELLRDAGHPNGTGIGEIVLYTTSSYLDLCEYIQNQLSELGLNIIIEVNPPSTHRQMVATSKLSFFRGSWIADYADGENYLALFYSRNFCPMGPNYTHFKNHEFDLLYEESLSESNDTLRFHLYNKMDQIIINEAPIVPLYYDRVVRFTQNNIIGLENNAMNMLNLKTVKKNHN
ncbi:MAG: ABC transporter substrate-binding protein [Bacteroidota bacterium]|nr:ABC transporter substrate-binding protein [Bacteroidota bacterium]